AAATASLSAPQLSRTRSRTICKVQQLLLRISGQARRSSSWVLPRVGQAGPPSMRSSSGVSGAAPAPRRPAMIARRARLDRHPAARRRSPRRRPMQPPAPEPRHRALLGCLSPFLILLLAGAAMWLLGGSVWAAVAGCALGLAGVVLCVWLDWFDLEVGCSVLVSLVLMA